MARPVHLELDEGREWRQVTSLSDDGGGVAGAERERSAYILGMTNRSLLHDARSFSRVDRSLALIGALLLAASPEPCRACEPEDSLAYVGATNEGFVALLDANLTRFDEQGSRIGERTLPLSPLFARVLSDGRTLLVVSEGPGEWVECLPPSLRFNVLDVLANGAPRRLGQVGANGTEFSGPRVEGDELVFRIVSTDRAGDPVSEVVRVGPSTRRLQPTRATEAASEARSMVITQPGVPLAVHPLIDERGQSRLAVRDVSGATRITLELTDGQLSLALALDGSHLAIASAAPPQEEGQALEPRFEIVDLATGAVTRILGASSGVSAVRGRARVSCGDVVNDPESPLNVRESASPRAAVRGTVPDQAPVTVVEREGSWARITAPVQGWVWAANLSRSCRLESP
jgi:hypothetical protein